jgi:hypothetical protein
MSSQTAPLVSRHKKRLGRVFRQRCVYLFFALILLIMAEPFLVGVGSGRVALIVVHTLVLVAACAAMSPRARTFSLAIVLAAAGAVIEVYSAFGGALPTPWFRLSCKVALYAVVLETLFAYVLRREVMTADKLWGAAAAFLLIGVLWSGLYEAAQFVEPASFTLLGAPVELDLSNRIFFSFTVLTSTGLSTIAPVSDLAKTLCLLEEITGVLFLTTMIARLAGIYLPDRA